MFYVLSIVAIAAILFAFIGFGLSPPAASNEVTVRKGYTDWRVQNGHTINGESAWAFFADAGNYEAVKIYHCAYWGGVLLDKNVMSWENNDGSYSSKSLTLTDLTARWQDSASVFKFTYENEFYTVSFSIPKLEDGSYKYADLTEAWENAELHQIIEAWMIHK